MPKEGFIIVYTVKELRPASMVDPKPAPHHRTCIIQVTCLSLLPRIGSALTSRDTALSHHVPGMF